MRMQFDRSVLQKELQAVQQVTGKAKSTLPALQHVLMESTPNGCSVTATDLSIAIRGTCAVVQADTLGGQVLLPAAKLYEIVQALPTGADVAFNYDDKHAKVTCGGFTSRLNVLPAAEFPSLAQVPDAPPLVLPRKILSEMVRKTRYAISADDTRFYLAGAQLATTGEVLSMVATDGHRLAIVTAPMQAEKMQTILPAATLRELAALVDGEGADVTFRRGDNHLFFECGTRLLISRVVDGQFPAWDKIVPKGNDKRALVKRGPLEESLQRVSIMSDMRSRAVKVQLDGNLLRISGSSADNGEANDVVDQEYAGPQITMSFNARYMLDFLNATDGDTVSLELKDEVSQALLRAVGTEGYDYTYVLMPMRV